MSLATLIASLRILAKDSSTSNQMNTETPKELTDATNTHFRLQYKNIVGTSATVHSVYVSFSTTWRTQTGFTMDLTNGIVTFGSAPASGVELNFDYNFYWFTDAEHTEFLNDAATHLGQTDPTSVDAALKMALMQYALGYYWQARAAQYAHRYSSSATGVSAQVDTVTKNFTTLSKNAFDQAEKFRLQYYERQGGREAPASGTVNYGIDPYTPMR